MPIGALIFCESKAAMVNNTWVLRRHIGRIVGEGISDVGVLMLVIAVHLTAAGHRDRIISGIAVIRLCKIFYGKGIGIIFKIPFAIQNKLAFLHGAIHAGDIRRILWEIVAAVLLCSKMENMRIFIIFFQ